MTEDELIEKMANELVDINPSTTLHEIASITLSVVKSDIEVVATVCPQCRGGEAFATSKMFNHVECSCKGFGVVLRSGK